MFKNYEEKYGIEKAKKLRKNRSEFMKNRIVSQETRKKMSESKKGIKHPYFGKHFSEEHKRKLSISHKGKIKSVEHRKNLSLSKIGHKTSEETKIKMSLAHKGRDFIPWNKGKKDCYSQETLLLKKQRAKEVGCGKWMKGKSKPKEVRKKLSENAKINPNYGMRGKHHTDETKLKISLKESREKHNNWLGGKSFEPYSLDWTKTLKRSIRERDRYTCKICLNEGFSVHHIDYNKLNCNPENLITLCKKCHAKTNYNRNKWIDFFNKLIGAENE